MHYAWITATDLRTYKRRYRILDDLEDRPRTVKELAGLHGVSENTIRRHIQELRREGTTIRYNPSDRMYYTARNIVREEERRKREMIPSKTLSDYGIKIEGTDHTVEIGRQDLQPLIGVTRSYLGRNTIWSVQTLKETSFGGQECYETRRDVYDSTMSHICYSYFYDQITDGGRYLIGDVQTNATMQTLPIVCFHKPKEKIHPLPLIDGKNWKDIHTEEQPYFSLREGKGLRVKTSCEVRGKFRITVQNKTYYCLRVLRATEMSLSEVLMDENGVEVLLRNYASEGSPGWRDDLRSCPSIKIDGRRYHQRGEGMALVESFRVPC